MRFCVRVAIATSPEELAACASLPVMGIVEFGARPQFAADAQRIGCPYAFVRMEEAAGGSYAEVWYGSQPVSYATKEGIRCATDGYYLFSALSRPAVGDLSATGYDAYHNLLQILCDQGIRSLVRMWNYVPGINAEGAERERYREFCTGREKAFGEFYAGKPDTFYPAATGIGRDGDDLTVCLIARKEAEGIVNLENPRQVPAYQYPADYGRSSPKFARATFVDDAKEPRLFVSGTASIIGHATVNVGDGSRQTVTTAENIALLISEENLRGYAVPEGYCLADFQYIRVYIRRREDYPRVKAVCEERFAGVPYIFYHYADICRSDLLMEIEGVI